MTWRNLLRVVRNPELLVFATIQPIIFVLMFRYVFGGAIKVPGFPYVDFLMPGIWIQTITFGSITTAVGLAEDLQGGLIERFRSLPMARSSVLIGRTFADLARNVFVVSLMTAVGFVVGFRYHTSGVALLAALGLVLRLLVRDLVGVRVRRPLRPGRRDRAGRRLSRSWRSSCSPPRRSCRWRRCRAGSRPSPRTSR